MTAIPRFYEHWLGKDFDSPVEAVPVNCAQCEMVHPKGLTRDLGPFKPTLKCCTFHPYLPAFTLGALLLNSAAHEAGDAGQVAALESFLGERRLTPLGAIPRNSRPTSICETGKIEATRCTFLSNDGKALCTIRDYRPSPCAGYVCRSSKGAQGLSEWKSWEAKVAEFEWSLAHLAAFELGYTLDDVDEEFKNLAEAKAYFVRSYHAALQIPAP